MNSDKQNNLLSIIIIVLLLSQVLVSAVIVFRINNLETSVLAVLKRQEPQSDAPELIPNVSLDDDPQMGTSGAVITLVEFSDYECPFCKEAEDSIKTLMSEYKGKILLVYRDFPLENIHPHAFLAAEAADCAGEQNTYWKMHDLLFADQTKLGIDDLRKHAGDLGMNMDQFNNCLDSNKYSEEIRHDMKDGISYQVSATPTFFINGHRVLGGSLEQLKSTIDALLSNK